MLNFGIRNERLLNGLRKKVLECTSYKQGEKENKTFYDNDGNKLKTIYYKNGRIDFEQIVSFENGFHKSYKNYSPSGIPKEGGKYILNNQGQIIEIYHNGQIDEKYRYDSYGRITEVLYPLTGGKNIYEYDENDLAIKLLSIQEGINFFGGPSKQLTLFVNDDFGNIISFKTFNGDTNELLYSQNNEINEEGDIVQTIGKLSNNTIVDEIKYCM
jgi:YD repeat-containing protein